MEPAAGAAAAAAPVVATVLGNCARCGSGDKLKFCSRCQAVRYCSSVCQAADVSVGLHTYCMHFEMSFSQNLLKFCL